MAQMVGGIGESKDATPEVQGYCEEMKQEVLKKSGKESFDIYEAVTYKTQLVAGTNYFVKIKIHPNGECIHARIYQQLPHTGGALEVTSVQTNKQEADAVEYF
ncbi:cystatin-B-like [Mercenaria mercenaria]|uniref:cystatin-B-like n=1 Tax=Mercenaria mercenaria TaxID=6596 RepID=UPI00234EFF16|nr:cystatin-B-like [Mercenaria mercenaria]